MKILIFFTGVYLMPELDDLRKYHGVIFLRRGFDV